MKRSEIINQIKAQCISEYHKIDDWVHDIYHIRRVVRNGKRLAQKEGLSSLNATLVEIACWLHDIGRVGEQTGLEFTMSNHAEVSYQKSKAILVPFQKQLGREGMYKILQAVREHNQPSLLHPENVVGRVLVDADRGAGLSILGIYPMLSYLHVTHLEPVLSQDEGRRRWPSTLDQLEREGKLKIALEKISFLNDWYYGTQKQKNTGAVVHPLYTKSAKRMFKRGIKEVERVERELVDRIETRQKVQTSPHASI